MQSFALDYSGKLKLCISHYVVLEDYDLSLEKLDILDKIADFMELPCQKERA